MKYVRFQGLEPNLRVPSKKGIFQLAYRLKRSPETSRHDYRELRQILNWLETNLLVPQTLKERKQEQAICWFKDSAHEPMKRIWALRHLLGEYGYWIDQIKTANPRLVVYQDDWQVAAKPFRDRTWE
jgi:hypothetical protein